MKQILVIHGPNLNMLGLREPEYYGHLTLAEIDAQLENLAEELGVQISTFQSNSEGDIVTAIQNHIDKADAILINPAAYTHTSIAIRDAIAASALPVVEVHLSNLHAREPWRQRSLTGAAAKGIISGFGEESYRLAILHLAGLAED